MPAAFRHWCPGSFRTQLHTKIRNQNMLRSTVIYRNRIKCLLWEFPLVGPGVSLTLWWFVVYSTRRFVICLTFCHFVLVFFSPFSIAITSLGEERANLSAFRTFVRFVLVRICRFPLPLGVWEGLRFVIVALPGLFSYLFFHTRQTRAEAHICGSYL